MYVYVSSRQREPSRGRAAEAIKEAVSQLQFHNGLYEHTQFNSRLQPDQLGLGTTQGGTQRLGLTFTYGSSNNNGNILSQTITHPGFSDAQHYRYDGVNRLTIVAEGLAPSEDDVCPGGAAWCRDYDYDAFGKLAAEYSDAAPASADVGTFYRTTDHLGSTRLVTKADGTAKRCYDFYPFGEGIPSNVGGRSSELCYGGSEADSFKQQFTGKERDDESDMHYFLARYYASSLGRFTSVDPGSANAKLPLPQTWNGYAYVDNRPFRFVDPDGTQSQIAECAYECASIAAGLVSLDQNFRAGNYFAPTIDAGGVLLDSLALAAPGIPGIVGFAIQGARRGSNFIDGASEVSDGARRFFHGTDIESARRLLGGEGLDASTAAAKKIDGAPGFFLADDAAAAEFFAHRREPGGVLQFDFSEGAIGQLTEAGATIGPVPQGKISRPPGNELRITEDLFDLFNQLRESGEITVTGVQ